MTLSYASTLTAKETVQPSLPGLVDLARTASALRVPKSPVLAPRGGAYRSAFRGRGMEFDESRLYLPGDDVRSLDWKVTARTGKAHTKVFREERERPILLSIDLRASMQFATRGVFKSVMAARLAALLAWAGSQKGDRVGGQVIHSNFCVEHPPRTGKRGVLTLLNQITSSPAASTSNPAEPSLGTAVARLATHCKPGDLIFIFSDFADLDAGAEQRLALLGRHAVVYLFFIYDPFEERWPEVGRLRIQQAGRERWLDTSNPTERARHEGNFQLRRQRLEQAARRWRLRLVTARTDDDPSAVLRDIPAAWR